MDITSNLTYTIEKQQQHSGTMDITSNLTYTIEKQQQNSVNSVQYSTVHSQELNSILKYLLQKIKVRRWWCNG
jgi:major membrane immunogen (membrane-anchored lipoprotein)